MKILYLPNETDETDIALRQVGPRRAFAQMLQDGTIKSCEIFSYRSCARQMTLNGAKKVILAKISEIQPDVIFIQHVTHSNFTNGFWKELRDISKNSIIVYHDEDAYSKYIKRIDSCMQELIPHTDICLISAIGSMADLYRQYGARRVEYMPHYFDSERFGILDPSKSAKSARLVMIGSNSRHRRLKYVYMPGGRRRVALATAFSQQFGSDFAIYGRGWDFLRSSTRGVIDFVSQERVIQSASISVNWDNFDHLPYYCSDRLPISLAAAIPHVTSYHAGYEFLFRGCPGLYWGHSPQEVIDISNWLLSRPADELLSEGLAAREWAMKHQEAGVVFRGAVDLIRREIENRRLKS